MKNENYTTKDKIKDFFGILFVFILYWLIMTFINIIEPETYDNYYNDPPEDIELNY